MGKVKKHAGHFKPAGQEPRRAMGGRRDPPGGRPSNKEKEMMQRAEDYAKKFLEKRLGKMLLAYEKASLGLRRRKHHPKTGKLYHEIEYDTANQRHWLDKFVPPIQKIEATGKDGRPLVPWTVVAPNPDSDPDPTPPDDKKDD